MREARVESAMTTPVATIAPEESVRAAATAMREQKVNSLLVPAGETGIVTSTDVLDALAAGEDPDDCHVESVMTVPVEWIRSDLWLEEAAAMMETHGINHLPVRDRAGDYVGMVSSRDVRETFVELGVDE